MSSPVRWRAPHAARCPFPDAVLLDPPCAAPWLCHQRDGPRRFFVRALPPRAAFLAARGFTCALDPVCVSRCSVRKGLTRRFSGSDDACRFLQRYDTRAHPGDERSNLHPERDRDLFRARRVVAHPAGERRRRDASVARCRPRLREQRPGTRHGPLLVRTLEHPSHRRGPLRGLESLATRHVGRDRPPPPPREGRRIEVDRGAFHPSGTSWEDASSPGARPPFTPPLTLVLGIAHEGRAFVSAAGAPRSGEPSAARRLGRAYPGSSRCPVPLFLREQRGGCARPQRPKRLLRSNQLAGWCAANFMTPFCRFRTELATKKIREVNLFYPQFSPATYPQLCP